jgi:uncharacterized protein YjbI with pentapeptide repeats
VANKEQVEILTQGVEAWNSWRLENRTTRPNLIGANLRVVNLRVVNLTGADLVGAILTAADLSHANLRGANLNSATLISADLRRADLSDANLTGAILTAADLSHANLRGANLNSGTLNGAILSNADLSEAFLNETGFVSVDLTSVIGLETCTHTGPSTVDHRTLQKSGRLPLSFLRGVGLPDNFIEYLPSLLNQPIQHYSCFISYSTKDQKFADQLYADLQNKGVRCWFAPHDLPIGAKTWDAIDQAIKIRDKLLLILSKNSIDSEWVEDEVQKAFAEERDRKELMLFPVRIDDAVMETPEPWARKLRDQRNIGDFRQWNDHEAYKRSLDRMLRDLAMTRSPAPPA